MDQISIYKKFQLHILEFSEVQDNKMLEKAMKQRIPIMFLFALKGETYSSNSWTTVTFPLIDQN
jgi:hypothetical protein